MEARLERTTGASASKGAVAGLLRGVAYGGLASLACGPLFAACAGIAIPAGAAFGLALGSLIGVVVAPEAAQVVVRHDELPPEPLRGQLAALLERRTRDPAVLAASQAAKSAARR